MSLTAYRTLGRSGLVVSPLALGTMTFGNSGWGSSDDVSRAVFDAYVEAGGNLVLYASQTPLDRAAVEASIATWPEGATTGVLSEPGDVETFTGKSPVLTDDFAPVDQLLGR